MNDQNLIPFSERTESERREIARKGGKRSGEIRRERRRMQKLFEVAASLTASEDDKKYYNKVLNANEENIDNEMVFVASVFEGAKAGNDSDKRILLRMLGGDAELNEKIRNNQANEKLRKRELDIREKELEKKTAPDQTENPDNKTVSSIMNITEIIRASGQRGLEEGD